MAVKDSRSSTSTKPEQSPIEVIREEMALILSANRYGKGPATKADLLEKITHWRARLEQIEASKLCGHNIRPELCGLCNSL